MAALSVKKLDKYMQNQGQGQFTFDVFKAAYDADPKLQELVTNFDDTKIEFKSSEADDLPASEPSTDNTVSNMAKRATDL